MFFHDFRALAQAGIHVQEYHAQLPKLFLDVVVNGLAFILRAYACEKLSLSFRNAELVKRALDVLRHIVPAPALLFHGLYVIKYIVEVYLQLRAPLRHRAGEKYLQRA